MVRVEGSYTALDRKLWLVLLHNAWDNLDKPGFVHEANVADVLRLFRQFGRRDLGQRGAVQSGKRTVFEIRGRHVQGTRPKGQSSRVNQP